MVLFIISDVHKYTFRGIYRIVIFKGGSKMDYIEFYNGNQMPMLGLGTFQ